MLGGDYKLTNNLILGAAFEVSQYPGPARRLRGHVTNNGYSLSAFGTYYIANTMYVDGIATYTWNAYDLERNVQSASETARGHPDGNQFALSVGSGYDFHVGALTAGPTFRVNYLNIFIDGYRERGAATSDPEGQQPDDHVRYHRPRRPGHPTPSACPSACCRRPCGSVGARVREQ